MKYFFFTLFQNFTASLWQVGKQSKVVIFSFASSPRDEVVSVVKTVQKVGGRQIASYSVFSFA